MQRTRLEFALMTMLLGLGSLTAYGATEDDKITADQTTTSNALFGTSVAISGATVVVGALGNNDAGTFAGSAYLFDCGSFPCAQVSKLTASDAAGGDTFGWSAGVSGTIAVVGAIEDDASGSAYYFALPACGATCSETGKLKASDATRTSKFGFRVGVSGTTAVVGTFSSDAAYVFDLATCGAACTETEKLTASDGVTGDRFGLGVAISGTTIVVGSPFDDDGVADAGSAYVFDCSSPPCVEVSKLTASDATARAQFGESVAVSGTTAVVGTGSLSESAYYFDLSSCGAACTETGKLTASDSVAGDSFGTAVAVGGTAAVVGAPTDDEVGRALSGSAYLFDLAACGAACTETEKLTASDSRAGDRLGLSVATSESIAVAGAPNDDEALFDSGSAYLFELDVTGREVLIDIKPGSDPNSINPRSRGVIPVAILTTTDLDAWDVDAGSLAFGPDGAGIAHAQGHAEDVDGDGDLDMVVHFRTRETGIFCGDDDATLTGTTLGGQAIVGTDSIKTVGCR